MIKYSVIIPVYNSKETLSSCLTAIKKQASRQTEIIVVDDCSTQKGMKEIVKCFTNNFFQLKKNYGAGRVRNFGAKKAKGEWLIFIDSDVVISGNFFKEVTRKTNPDSFKEKLLPKKQCLQGVYSWQTPIGSIYSQYKNLYYYYNFFYRIKKEKYSYLSSHCFILRKEAFEEVGGFNPQIKGVSEDADLGFRLFQKGYSVILDTKLLVTHLKNFSLSSLLKNDAKLSFAKVKHILRNIHKKDSDRLVVVSGGRMSEMYPIIGSVLLSPIILVVLLLSVFFQNSIFLLLLVLLLFAFALLNFNFIKFIGDKKGTLYLLKIIPIFYLDMLSAFFGTMIGVVDYFLFVRRY